MILSDEYFRVENLCMDPKKTKSRQRCSNFMIFLLSAGFLLYSIVHSLLRPVLNYIITKDVSKPEDRP